MPERAPALLDARTHGIDAGGRPQVVVEHEVGGREADGAAARIAGFDAALDLPEAAEQRRRLTGVSGCKELADARRGVDGALGRRDRTDYGDAEMQIRAARLEQRRRAAPLVAEDEIVADDGVAHAEIADEHGLDEILCALRGEGEVEMQREQQIDAERLEVPRLGAERRQAKGRVVRPENTAGMRLEGEDRVGHGGSTGDSAGLADHRLMAEMDAVEIADGDNRPALGGCYRVVAEEAHGLGKYRVRRVLDRGPDRASAAR